jgi:hypothetical protein
MRASTLCPNTTRHELRASPITGSSLMPASYLEGSEQVDLDDTPKLVEQGPHLILIGRAQHLGEKQLHIEHT